MIGEYFVTTRYANGWWHAKINHGDYHKLESMARRRSAAIAAVTQVAHDNARRHYGEVTRWNGLPRPRVAR